MKKIAILLAFVGAICSVGLLYAIVNFGKVLEDAYIFDEEYDEE
jgi:hypothetical protein